MSYQLMFQKAVELQQNGALNEAEKIYRQILQTTPENADVLNLLGLIAQTRGIHNEAISYFYQAAAAAPKHFIIYFNLAVSLGAIGKFAEAVEAYQKVLQLKPDCKEAHLGLGNLYWRQNNISAAKEEFNAALQIDANYAEAIVNLAEITDDVETLREAFLSNPQALYYLGRRAFQAKDFIQAEEYLQKANNLLEDDEIKAMLGETLLELKQRDKALILFYQTYQLNPHNLTAVLNIADINADKHNFAEAEIFYKKAIEIDAQNLHAHNNYANMLSNNKRLLEALEEYRAAVLIAPQTPEISYNLSLILKSLEEYEQALDLMFHAYYLAPQNIDWCLNIAETIILFYNKAPQKACKICENWYQKMPDNLVVKHLWNALHNQNIEDEKEYNRLLFDTFADNYEQTLKNINYKTADYIADLCKSVSGNILDLGCGTGLIGAKICSENNHITGVDISPNMLNVAKSKNCYKELICDDIIHYLQQQSSSYSLIIAADVFCYFGALDIIIELCKNSSLIFSVEIDESAENYLLQPNGRYKHNPQYIRQLLHNSGFVTITEYPLILRQENGKDVSGMIFYAKK